MAMAESFGDAEPKQQPLAPFRQHVVGLTETAFAKALLKELRQRGGKGSVSELHEEWLSSGDGGRVYEIRAEVEDLP